MLGGRRHHLSPKMASFSIKMATKAEAAELADLHMKRDALEQVLLAFDIAPEGTEVTLDAQQQEATPWPRPIR